MAIGRCPLTFTHRRLALRFFISNVGDCGPTYYRQLLPVRHLTKRVRDELGVRLSFLPGINLRVPYDAMFFSRTVKPFVLPLLAQWKQAGVKIVWDMDDDLFDMSRLTNPTSAMIGEKVSKGLMLRECLDLADLVTVSMPALGRYCDPGKVVVVPNLIDLDDNQPEQGDTAPRNVILYSASPSHVRDLELIRGLHARTQKKYRWIFYGIDPPWRGHSPYVPWGRVHDYPKVCRLFRPAVSLAPLEACQFNECKSPIKVWESATYGGSVLASNTGPYRGHPAAIVPEGEPFTVDHLDSVLARPNGAECLEVARQNSWQYSPLVDTWYNMFKRVRNLCNEVA